jgi:hypothetical protein
MGKQTTPLIEHIDDDLRSHLERDPTMEKPPMLNSELVNKFVRVAHSDLAKVKELLEQEPKLINAAWDWGGGDWETALGAAAHMG